MGFFNYPTGKGKQRPTGDKEIVEWCMMLGKATQKKAHRRTNFLTTWRKYFVKLRDEYDSALIEQVLNWYCDHIDEPMVPQAYSSKSFMEKFKAIMSAMDREEPPKATYPDVIKRKAFSLGDEFPWPIEVRGLLCALLYRTAEKWRGFELMLSYYNQTKTTPAREHTFINRLLSLHGYTFPYDWMQYLGRKIGHLEHYHGPVMSLAWSLENRWFLESFWRQWSLEWSGGLETFDSLYQTLRGMKDDPEK